MSPDKNRSSFRYNE